MIFAWQRSTVDGRLTPVIFHGDVPASVAPALVATTHINGDLAGRTLEELARVLPPPQLEDD